MFANLGVTIAGTAENFIIGFCKIRDVTCTNKYGDAHFRFDSHFLGCALKCTIHELQGHPGN